MLHAVKGQVWFTETGGIVSRANRHKVTFPESAKHAATATRFLFDKLVPLSRAGHARLHLPLERGRAARRPGTPRWSARPGARGPAYKVVERVLQKQARRRAARAAREQPPAPPTAPPPASAPPVPPPG